MKMIKNPKFEFYKSTVLGKKIAVLGLGISNLPIIEMLNNLGAIVIGCDRNPIEKFDKNTLDMLNKNTKSLYFGESYLSDLNNQDIIFRTPGLHPNTPELVEAEKMGAIVTSEMETFFSICPCKIIGVTGSDGKTTTTTLIAEILRASGKNVHVGGNIGNPLLPIVEQIKATDYVVVELSSFQLQNGKYSPDIAVITNVAPNHLDYHKDMNEYIDAKKTIFLNQNPSNKLIINMNNEITNKCEDEACCEVIKFSLNNIPKKGAYLLDDKIYYNDEFLMFANNIKLPGIHNIDNFLAAISATYEIANKSAIIKVAKTFGGVKHRLEFVREFEGIKFYNDSIASSPTRTTAGLKSFDKKVILIAGGYDKKIPFEGFGEIISKHVKTLVLIGATAKKIRREVESVYEDTNNECLPIIDAPDLEFAIKASKAVAEDGDVVLLSPACASFDMFKNFEVRGDKFKELVLSLKE